VVEVEVVVHQISPDVVVHILLVVEVFHCFGLAGSILANECFVHSQLTSLQFMCLIYQSRVIIGLFNHFLLMGFLPESFFVGLVSGVFFPQV